MPDHAIAILTKGQKDTDVETKLARMSPNQIMAGITELSKYLTGSEIERLEIGKGEITWKPEEEVEF